MPGLFVLSTVVTVGSIALLRVVFRRRPAAAPAALVATMVLAPFVTMPGGHGFGVSGPTLGIIGMLPVGASIAYFLAYYARAVGPRHRQGGGPESLSASTE